MIIIAKMLNKRHLGALSNALNKAGICQEIDFKRSEYLDWSMRHTNHSSIFGMTTMCIVQSLYSSRHDVNQDGQGLKGQSLPCINECLSQFRHISRLVGICRQQHEAYNEDRVQAVGDGVTIWGVFQNGGKSGALESMPGKLLFICHGKEQSSK
jgi:hypothetical protein